jgi:hypothetical protein
MLLIFTYDEHGGYYDHVPPPAAVAPDSIPPMVQPGESAYDGFSRYGFRVPAVLVGPYAKRDYVSHVVYDDTSILAFLERKRTLPALTYRDANANDLTDFLDLGAMAPGQPAFPELPATGRGRRHPGCAGVHERRRGDDPAGVGRPTSRRRHARPPRDNAGAAQPPPASADGRARDRPGHAVRSRS